MVQVTSSLAPIDLPIEEAARERPGEPIRIRLQPSILRHEAGRPSPHYGAWRQLHWNITVGTLDEARALREALSAFFHVAQSEGITAARQKLLTGTTAP